VIFRLVSRFFIKDEVKVMLLTFFRGLQLVTFFVCTEALAILHRRLPKLVSAVLLLIRLMMIPTI